MGLISSLLRREERAATPAPDDDYWYQPVGRASASGIRVDETLAMNLSAVFCAVRILAESVAQLPLILYRRGDAGGKERAVEHPLYGLLHDQPNDEQSSFEWREMLMGHLAVRGNAYAQIERYGNGTVAQLWPLNPANMTASRARRPDGTLGRDLVYTYRLAAGEQKTLRPDQVLHLRGLSSDGVYGLSPVALARESIGTGLAAEAYGARFFRHNATPPGILTHPGKLKPEARANLRESWQTAHTGENQHKIAVLEEGLTYTSIGLSNEDAQFLQTRKFQVNEIARWWNIPPHMLKDLERATFSNIEQQSLEFVVYSLMPWLKRWEQAIARSVLTAEERRTYFVEFNVDGLLRGDALTRAQALQLQRQNGIINADEWRAIENMNPQPDGQGKPYLVPLNMISAASAVTPTPAPAPAAARAIAHLVEARALPSPEMRQVRSVTARKRVQGVYRRLFVEAAGRVVRKEVAAARRAVKKLVGARSLRDDVEQWAAEFYGPSFRDSVVQAMLPVLLAFAEAIHAEAADEVASDPGMSEELERFVRSYADSQAERHAGSSAGQIVQIVTDTPAEEAPAALEARFGEWEEKRPGKIADRQIVQAAAAVAKQTYAAAGIRKLRWSGSGGDCGLCRAFDGRVVAIDEDFLAKGETAEVEGQEPLRAHSSIGHPPLHGGCDCQLVAEIG